MDEQAFTEALGREGYDEVFTKTALVTQVLGTHSPPFAVKALVTDGQLTLGIGGALTGFPQNRRTALGADDGIHRILQHQHLVGHANS